MYENPVVGGEESDVTWTSKAYTQRRRTKSQDSISVLNRG